MAINICTLSLLIIICIFEGTHALTGEISVQSATTGDDIKTLLHDDPFVITISLTWEDSDFVWTNYLNDSYPLETNESYIVAYEVYIDGEDADSNYSMTYTIDEVPDTITTNEITVDKTGNREIEVTASLMSNSWGLEGSIDTTSSLLLSLASTDTMSTELYCITGFTTMVPLIFVVIVALTLKNVYVALFTAIWMGSFIISGCSFRYAFEMAVGTYILESAASVDHQFVILFTVFLSGLVFLVCI